MKRKTIKQLIIAISHVIFLFVMIAIGISQLSNQVAFNYSQHVSVTDWFGSVLWLCAPQRPERELDVCHVEQKKCKFIDIKIK